MTEIETLCNALGTIQSLYNFLHGSTKRHALFKDIKVYEEDVAPKLKSLSTTRWSCRWAAVRAVLEQVPRIMDALVTLSKALRPTTKVIRFSTRFVTRVCLWLDGFEAHLIQH